MKGTLKQLLLSAAVFTGFSAIASLPTQAATLTLDPASIQFNSTNFRTYSGGSSGTFTNGSLTTAKSVLTDANATSNVELWSSTENPLANVGFSGKLAGYNVKVESVTAADWNIFGSEWLDGFLNAYNGKGITVSGTTVKIGAQTTNKQALLASLLASGGLPSSGDPNIGAFTFNTTNNTFSLDLIGHHDLKPRLLAGQYTTGNLAWDNLLKGAALLIQGPLQASEIAKVTIGNTTQYAYSFNSALTGISTNDGSESYTGKYTWSKQVTPPATRVSQAVPEPSTLLGLAGLGGLLIAQRRKKASA